MPALGVDTARDGSRVGLGPGDRLGPGCPFAIPVAALSAARLAAGLRRSFVAAALVARLVRWVGFGALGFSCRFVSASASAATPAPPATAFASGGATVVGFAFVGVARFLARSFHLGYRLRHYGGFNEVRGGGGRRHAAGRPCARARGGCRLALNGRRRGYRRFGGIGGGCFRHSIGRPAAAGCAWACRRRAWRAGAPCRFGEGFR